jgi:hypothetical protein
MADRLKTDYFFGGNKMKKEIDIYNYGRRIRAATDIVAKSSISETNKKLIFDFIEHCTLTGIGVPRRSRYLGVLRLLAEIMKVDFDKATEADIKRCVRIIIENQQFMII